MIFTVNLSERLVCTTSAWMMEVTLTFHHDFDSPLSQDFRHLIRIRAWNSTEHVHASASPGFETLKFIHRVSQYLRAAQRSRNCSHLEGFVSTEGHKHFANFISWYYGIFRRLSVFWMCLLFFNNQTYVLGKYLGTGLFKINVHVTPSTTSRTSRVTDFFFS